MQYRERILVVDDDKSMRDLLKFCLSPHYVIEEAANGIEALRAVQYNRPDLIILDRMMPALDGNGVAELIKGDKTTASIPILMLTALVSTDDVVSGFEKGADDYLRKPFIVAELTARVEALMRRSKMKRPM